MDASDGLALSSFTCTFAFAFAFAFSFACAFSSAAKLVLVLTSNNWWHFVAPISTAHPHRSFPPMSISAGIPLSRSCFNRCASSEPTLRRASAVNASRMPFSFERGKSMGLTTSPVRAVGAGAGAGAAVAVAVAVAVGVSVLVAAFSLVSVAVAVAVVGTAEVEEDDPNTDQDDLEAKAVVVVVVVVAAAVLSSHTLYNAFPKASSQAVLLSNR
mmetsp:Transcript_14083/g.29761  ORF Transcript_14083/g.29761 Transcript_14083/m.29761 type:complete len:214 (+) Transcript_14083:433-1074(+)